MNVCDEVALAVDRMEGKILVFVGIKPFCISSLLFFISLLITNQFAFLISFLTHQESWLLVQHSDPKIMLLIKFKICFNILICLYSSLDFHTY